MRWFSTPFLAALTAGFLTLQAGAEPKHGIAMHGEPALPPDFEHLPYADPDAPQGGRMVYGVVGDFESLNPFIVKGAASSARGDWDTEFGNNVFESLMFRSRDEAFTLYGLLAETVETDDDRTFVEFTLRPEARFSDGEPLTVDDVIFSMNLLAEKGRPVYKSRMAKVDRMEKVGERGLRFVFNDQADRELPLLLGMLPIFPEHAVDPETFDQTTLEPITGSGPYVVEEVRPGERIVYRKNPDYWGKDISIKRGLDNFDEIRVEYFLNESALFEAFKKGLVYTYTDNNPTHWAQAYNFAAVENGDVVKETFKNGVAANMYGFIFNTRRPVFEDKTVRQALSLLFDFEWANKNLFGGVFERTESFYDNSELSSIGQPASDKEKALLASFPDAVDPEIMDGTYRAPVSDGSGRDRNLLRKAVELLKEAGYDIKDGRMVDAQGKQLSFEVVLSGEEKERLALAYQRTLERLGIEMVIRSVDDAQYQKRKQTYDFDMIMEVYSGSLSPGAEQVWRWGSRAVEPEGTFNFAGAADPAIDAMIDAMLQARSREDFIAAVRAYDRVLLSGYYVIPLYHTPEQFLARWTKVDHPEYTALYGYRYPAWWSTETEQ